MPRKAKETGAEKKQSPVLIEIAPIKVQTTKIRIVGDSPLIVHNWDTKNKQQMLDSQMGKSKVKAKDPKSPISDFIGSLYWLEGEPEERTEEAFVNAVKNGAKFGFQVSAIKKAANSAAYRLKWFKNQTALKGTYFIRSEYGPYIEIKGSVPEMREDMVRIGQNKPDIRYRGEFKNWSMDLLIEYTENGGISLEQIINCINAGGYCVGIGEWRPEKDGTYGMYHVEL